MVLDEGSQKVRLYAVLSGLLYLKKLWLVIVNLLNKLRIR
jgi:hypothetical protein